MLKIISTFIALIVSTHAATQQFKSDRIEVAKKILKQRMMQAQYSYIKTLISEYKISENKKDYAESKKLQAEILKSLSNDQETLIKNLAGTKWAWSAVKGFKETDHWIRFNKNGTVTASWRTEPYTLFFYNAYKMDIAGHVMTLESNLTSMTGHVINKKGNRYMRLIEGQMKIHPLLKNIRLVYPF